MTERTLRHMAKEICGQFYDEPRRSQRFRALHPDQRRYVNKYWPHFYDLAREMAVNMLRLPGLHQHLKDAIADALIEDGNKRARGGGLVVPQVMSLNDKEWEDVEMADNPAIPISKAEKNYHGQ